MLTLAGVGVVGLLVVGVAVGALAAVTADQRTSSAPDVDWAFERVNETHVQVSHAGGDPALGSELIVSVDGRVRPTGWSGTVAEGDVTTIPAAGGQVVRVYWVDEGDRVRTQLEKWRA